MTSDPPSESSSTAAPAGTEAVAWFAGVHARRPVECVDVAAEPERIAAGGFWVVVGDFEGAVRAWRFAEVVRAPLPPGQTTWHGPAAGDWSTSMDRDAYCAGVAEVRRRIWEGDVYQVNLCRVLEAPLERVDGAEPPAVGLAARLAAGNPAPYAGGIHVPVGSDVPPVWVVSASPELFLRLDGSGAIASGPIKGTAATPDGLTDKDRAENVMIADMVRNDLQRVCDAGTVEVTELLALEHHPGLVHLVTTVQGRLRTGPAPLWSDILAATYPPASVSGAPKSSALEAISALEPVPRGPYCGAFGWVDADEGRAELAVGIRTFWWTSDEGGRLRFGTGAGITWGSDAAAEWAETELKAHRLIGLASAPS